MEIGAPAATTSRMTLAVDSRSSGWIEEAHASREGRTDRSSP